jgi:cell division protein FtsB
MAAMGSGGVRALAIGLVAALALAAAVPAQAQSSREQLEQQLKEQQAKNEVLKQRIDKLEAILKTDICADPAAAEALLKETQPPPTPPR